MYVDVWDQSPDDVEAEFLRMADAGVSHIIMAFHLEGQALFTDNIADTVALWNDLSDAERLDIVSKLHQKGTKLLISSGGETEGLYWQSQDPTSYGQRLCTLAKTLHVDGVDFDKEGFGYVTRDILDWSIAATKACRQVWPEAIITSAPQSPHLYTSSQYNWADGITEGAPHDYYLIQYYNQGTWSKDTTYDGLFNGSGVGAINELVAKYGSAARADQFVVGKPYLPAHAGSGFVELTELRKIICTAWNANGYRGGLMFWKHPWGQDLSSITMLSQPCDTAGEETTAVPTTSVTTPSTRYIPPTPPLTSPTVSTTSTQGRPFSTPTLPAAPTTRPAGPTTTAPSDGDLVSACRARLTAKPESIRYEYNCKEFCQSYLTGPLAPVRPSEPTLEELIREIVSHQSVCMDSRDPVSACQARITAKPESSQFESSCKEFCQSYSSNGSLSAWCPTSATVEQLIQCVVTQQAFCIDTQ